MSYIGVSPYLSSPCGRPGGTRNPEGQPCSDREWDWLEVTSERQGFPSFMNTDPPSEAPLRRGHGKDTYPSFMGPRPIPWGDSRERGGGPPIFLPMAGTCGQHGPDDMGGVRWGSRSRRDRTVVEPPPTPREQRHGVVRSCWLHALKVAGRKRKPVWTKCLPFLDKIQVVCGVFILFPSA